MFSLQVKPYENVHKSPERERERERGRERLFKNSVKNNHLASHIKRTHQVLPKSMTYRNSDEFKNNSVIVSHLKVVK